MDKLGIYIPTKDRPVELKECLNSLIYQVKQFGFPIYISDNSGNDETKKLVVKLRENYRKIYYRRNPYKGLNGTYASNLKSVIEMGKTEFVWFLGDDDIIFKNAVNKIAKNLDGNQFLQINMAIYDNNLTKILNHRVIKRYKDMEYYPGMHEEVMLNAQPEGYVGFMGSIIIKRKMLVYELQKIKNTDEMDFLHTVLFYRAIVNKKGKFIAQPLIKYRTGADLGERTVRVWVYSFPKTMNMLKQNYSEKIIRDIAYVKAYSAVSLSYHICDKYPKESRKAWMEIKNSKYVSLFGKMLAYMFLRIPIIYFIVRKLKRVTA